MLVFKLAACRLRKSSTALQWPSSTTRSLPTVEYAWLRATRRATTPPRISPTRDLVDQVRKAGNDALHQLIERALIIQEFNEKGYKIPETTIEQQINDIISSDYGGNRAAFVKTLEAENLTLSQYRDQVRERVIIQAMRGHKTQQTIVVSPYKMEKYYNENLDQYKAGEQIKLRMIFIKRGEPIPAASVAEQILASSTNQLSQTNLLKQQSPRCDGVRRQRFRKLAATLTNAAETGVTNATTTTSANETKLACRRADLQRKLADEILTKLDAGDSFESRAQGLLRRQGRSEGGRRLGAGSVRTFCARNSTKSLSR